MKIYQYVFLLLLCVKSQVSLTAPGELPSQKFVCTWFCVTGRVVAEIQDFPLYFYHFIPAGYFKHEAFTLSVSPVSLHSTAHQRRNWKREQCRCHILPKPDCKQGCSCCLMLPHRRFLFWCQGCCFFMNSPSAWPSTPTSPKHVSLWVKLSQSYESPSTMTLLSFPHLGQRPERIFGDAMRQFNKTVYSPATQLVFFFQSNTCLAYG